MKQEVYNRPCIGFGEFEGKCRYVTVDNPHWCPRCNALRIEHITKQLEEIAIKAGIFKKESEVEHNA